MITSEAPTSATLGTVVRSVGLGWRLDLFGPPDQANEYLQRRLSEGDDVARVRFSDDSVRLTTDNIAALAVQSPDKACAFVEQLFGQGDPQMLVMAWRVLNGADVGAVRLDLDQAARFRLEITLRPDRQGTEEKYESSDVSDLSILRQFGIAKLNGKLPVLIGFYPTWRPPA
jgi:hypothetical protein